MEERFRYTNDVAVRNIRDAITASGMTVTDVARGIGMAPTQLFGVLGGQRTCTLKLLIRLCDFFGTGLDDMTAFKPKPSAGAGVL